MRKVTETGSVCMGLATAFTADDSIKSNNKSEKIQGGVEGKLKE